MRQVPVFVALVLTTLATTLATARADEAYEVTGEAAGRAYKGVVVVKDVEGGKVEVRHTRRFDADQSIEVLSGPGRRSGRTIEANVTSSAGVTEAVERIGMPASPPPPLRLVFETLEGERWRLRVVEGRRTVATGQGEARPLPELHGSARRWHELEGVPFVKGEADPTEVHVSDPRQGQLGDCYLISGMIALARTEKGRARLHDMITERGPGEYEVSLRGEGQFLIKRQDRESEKVDPRLNYDTRLRVDRRLPVDASDELVFAGRADTKVVDGNTLHELWPMLIERAYAQSAGSYAAIESGWTGDVFRIAGGTVHRHKTATMTDAEIEAVLTKALQGDHAVAISSGAEATALNGSLSVVRDHAYALMEARGGGFVLYNPWGSSHPTRPLTAADLRGLGATIEVCAM